MDPVGNNMSVCMYVGSSCEQQTVNTMMVENLRFAVNHGTHGRFER